MTMRCDCGAERAAIEITTAADRSPSYVPGPLLEPCRCPLCVSCGDKLDNGHCINLWCPLYGVFTPIPDEPGSQAHDPASRSEAS